jgi:hypothetical protein
MKVTERPDGTQKTAITMLISRAAHYRCEGSSPAEALDRAFLSDEQREWLAGLSETQRRIFDESLADATEAHREIHAYCEMRG